MNGLPPERSRVPTVEAWAAHIRNARRLSPQTVRVYTRAVKGFDWWRQLRRKPLPALAAGVPAGPSSFELYNARRET